MPKIRFKKSKGEEGNSQQAWAAWLSDDPVVPSTPEHQRPSTPTQQAPAKPQQAAPQPQPTTQQSRFSPLPQNSYAAPTRPARVAQPQVTRPHAAPQPQTLPTRRSQPVPTHYNQPRPANASIAQPTAQQTTPKPTQPAAGVSIQINLPEFKKPQFKRSKAAWAWAKANVTRKQLTISGAVLAVLILSWVGALIAQHSVAVKRKTTQASTSQSSAGGDLAAATPDYTPIVPSDKKSLATVDNVHSRYDATKKNYSYIDDNKGKQFTVSQQRLASAKEADDTAIKAAKSLNALVPLTTGWGKAYLLTNQKYNSQTLVFSVQDRLMFIQSSFVFPQDQWIQYINNLQ